MSLYESVWAPGFGGHLGTAFSGGPVSTHLHLPASPHASPKGELLLTQRGQMNRQLQGTVELDPGNSRAGIDNLFAKKRH